MARILAGESAAGYKIGRQLGLAVRGRKVDLHIAPNLLQTSLTWLAERASQIDNDIKSLHIQNRALTEQNERAVAFIKALLRHPAVSPFLEDLSGNGTIENPDLSATQAGEF